MITVFGRMPVLEALLEPRAVFEKVLVARTARGEAIDRILAEAQRRGVHVERTDAQRVTRVSRNGRQDQGVVADIASPGYRPLEDALPAGPVALIVLDSVTTPANVGMTIRAAVAAGLDGVVVPVAGCPDIGPLVVKASAGVALFAPVLRSPTAEGAVRFLAGAGVHVIGLAGGRGPGLWETEFSDRVAFVLGNETAGVSPAVASVVRDWCSIPLVGGVDSLNVASAATVVAFEVARRRATPA